MINFEDLFPHDLYHSYIIESSDTNTFFHLQKFLEKRGYIDQNSSDILCQSYDSFSISDSHIIKEWHSESGIDSKKRICIINTKFINHDAERTLLKILEEPAVNTHFFVIIPNSLMLLDTIRSRAHIVKIEDKNDNLIIKNIFGQQVFHKRIASQTDYLNSSNWGGNGLYFAHIIDSQGNTIEIRKIILQ